MENSAKQLSIFVENKAGSLNEIFEMLSRANIRIIASTLSDTTEYGILRLITDNNEAADRLLKSARKNSVIRDIVAVESSSSAGSLYTILHALTEAGLSVEYMYCFAQGGRSVTILRIDDNAAALDCIQRHGIKTLSNEDLLGL